MKLQFHNIPQGLQRIRTDQWKWLQYMGNLKYFPLNFTRLYVIINIWTPLRTAVCRPMVRGIGSCMLAASGCNAFLRAGRTMQAEPCVCSRHINVTKWHALCQPYLSRNTLKTLNGFTSCAEDITHTHKSIYKIFQIRWHKYIIHTVYLCAAYECQDMRPFP